MTVPTVTFVLMDAPFESAATATGFRLVVAALRRGFNVNVFAYEGAVALSFVHQKPHANLVHGRDVAQEEHPLPKDWVTAALAEAQRMGVKLDWINCGLCVDERGVEDAVYGTRRGSPADLWQMAAGSVSTLVIGAR
jgi:tRNA 2-thiouridine synthesizing protein D